MPTRNEKEKSSRRGRPATTLEGRENQIISQVIDLAEKQIRDGTATSQVMTHFLKLGSTTQQLEHEKLMKENELLTAKVNQLASAKRVEELMEEALSAMKTYSGNGDYED